VNVKKGKTSSKYDLFMKGPLIHFQKSKDVQFFIFLPHFTIRQDHTKNASCLTTLVNSNFRTIEMVLTFSRPELKMEFDKTFLQKVNDFLQRFAEEYCEKKLESKFPARVVFPNSDNLQESTIILEYSNKVILKIQSLNQKYSSELELNSRFCISPLIDSLKPIKTDNISKTFAITNIQNPAIPGQFIVFVETNFDMIHWVLTLFCACNTVIKSKPVPHSSTVNINPIQIVENKKPPEMKPLESKQSELVDIPIESSIKPPADNNYDKIIEDSQKKINDYVRPSPLILPSFENLLKEALSQQDQSENIDINSSIDNVISSLDDLPHQFHDFPPTFQEETLSDFVNKFINSSTNAVDFSLSEIYDFPLNPQITSHVPDSLSYPFFSDLSKCISDISFRSSNIQPNDDDVLNLLFYISSIFLNGLNPNSFIPFLKALGHRIEDVNKLLPLVQSQDKEENQVSSFSQYLLKSYLLVNVFSELLRDNSIILQFYSPFSMIASDELLENIKYSVRALMLNQTFDLSFQNNVFSSDRELYTRFISTQINYHLAFSNLNDFSSMDYAVLKISDVFSYGLKIASFPFGKSNQPFDFFNSIANTTISEKQEWQDFRSKVRELSSTSILKFGQKTPGKVEELIRFGLSNKYLSLWFCIFLDNISILETYYYPENIFCDPNRAIYFISRIRELEKRGFSSN
jgi:hypothetical protein